ncbi:hypothetical protein [Pantoea sp. S18]|uniref:hypothetical protein n=1 Tax=Pantoea sp. S18 TaxID=3019892 RepID=UPI002B21C031|nr:hypothetical protein [Pantoea sp. S18]MEA5104668.1 hypothetical protein [Pantoea sp. S18]
MEIFTYALIKDGDTKVENTILCEEDFILDGYYKVKIEDGVFCEIGMQYNAKKGTFTS